MAESANGTVFPSTGDVEMKDEIAEPSVHSIPPATALDQVAGAPQDDQSTPATTDETAAPSLAAQTQQPEAAPTSMEGILDGEAATAAPTTQSSLAQPPPAAPLPATTAAPASSMPVSAPTPPPARPSSIPPSLSLPPEKPQAHGSPTRVYLNQAVTPHLLEGMKYLAAYEPEKPLKWLSEFLAQRSAEMEGEA